MSTAGPDTKRILKDDHPDAPEWFGDVLETLNPFLTDTTEDFPQTASVSVPMYLETRPNLADTFSASKLLFKNPLGHKPKSVVLSLVAPQFNVDYTQETWTAPTLLNSWTNYNNGYAPVGYYKDGTGRVWLRGLVINGNISTGTTGDVFTLPTDYLPPYNEIFVQQSNDAFGELRVFTTGSVRAYMGDSTSFSLDGISFRSATGPMTASLGPVMWDITTSGLIRINYIAGLRPSSKYQLTLTVS